MRASMADEAEYTMSIEESTKDIRYPRVWLNKIKGEFFLVTPWWEVPDPLYAGKLDDGIRDRQVRVGTLVQVGWLIQNTHGVWFGVNISTQKQFQDLGEL